MGQSANRSWRVWLDTKIWGDAWFNNLPDDKHRLAFLHLFAAANITKAGIFEPDYLALTARLHVRRKRLDCIISKLAETGRIMCENSFILVCNFTKYQQYSGNALDSVVRDADNFVTVAPKLVQAWHELYPRYATGTPLPPQDKDKEQDKVISVETDVSPSAKPKRLKPKHPPLDEVLTQLPAECRTAWDGFAAMVAEQNTTKTVAESRLVGMLQEILRRCAECSPEAITHGLQIAIQKPADSAGFVATVAGNWTPGNRTQRQDTHPVSAFTKGLPDGEV